MKILNYTIILTLAMIFNLRIEPHGGRIPLSGAFEGSAALRSMFLNKTVVAGIALCAVSSVALWYYQYRTQRRLAATNKLECVAHENARLLMLKALREQHRVRDLFLSDHHYFFFISTVHKSNKPLTIQVRDVAASAVIGTTSADGKQSTRLESLIAKLCLKISGSYSIYQVNFRWSKDFANNDDLQLTYLAQQTITGDLRVEIERPQEGGLSLQTYLILQSESLS